ncbi:hypothetical protein RIF29_07774 [Crotalaria pallida]|uniref:Uncharacterized protein n=1 Tax=Crotalaria pallida TaxID=3830 RepID=A0AAN9J4P2_CROPI
MLNIFKRLRNTPPWIDPMNHFSPLSIRVRSYSSSSTVCHDSLDPVGVNSLHPVGSIHWIRNFLFEK